MTTVIDSILIGGMFSVVALGVLGIVPRKHPYLLRLVDATYEWRHWRYKRRWLRRRRWEVKHPLLYRQAGRHGAGADDEPGVGSTAVATSSAPRHT